MTKDDAQGTTFGGFILTMRNVNDELKEKLNKLVLSFILTMRNVNTNEVSKLNWSFKTFYINYEECK